MGTAPFPVSFSHSPFPPTPTPTLPLFTTSPGGQLSLALSSSARTSDPPTLLQYSTCASPRPPILSSPNSPAVSVPSALASTVHWLQFKLQCSCSSPFSFSLSSSFSLHRQANKVPRVRGHSHHRIPFLFLSHPSPIRLPPPTKASSTQTEPPDPTPAHPLLHSRPAEACEHSLLPPVSLFCYPSRRGAFSPLPLHCLDHIVSCAAAARFTFIRIRRCAPPCTSPIPRRLFLTLDFISSASAIHQGRLLHHPFTPSLCVTSLQQLPRNHPKPNTRAPSLRRGKSLQLPAELGPQTLYWISTA